MKRLRGQAPKLSLKPRNDSNQQEDLHERNRGKLRLSRTILQTKSLAKRKLIKSKMKTTIIKRMKLQFINKKRVNKEFQLMDKILLWVDRTCSRTNSRCFNHKIQTSHSQRTKWCHRCGIQITTTSFNTIILYSSKWCLLIVRHKHPKNKPKDRSLFRKCNIRSKIWRERSRRNRVKSIKSRLVEEVKARP